MPTSHPKLTREALQEAIVEAARCVSSRRHVLEPIEPPLGAPRPSFGSYLFQRCLVCGTVTRDKVSRITGQRISPRIYDKPAWYEAALAERHDGDWWRATYWETLDVSFFLDAEHTTKVTPIKRRKAS